jgi:hypothetical protein
MLSRLTLGAVVTALTTIEALAAGDGTGGFFQRSIRVVSSPEIDGPAGLAAMAVVASMGLIAYRRFKR